MKVDLLDDSEVLVWDYLFLQAEDHAGEESVTNLDAPDEDTGVTRGDRIRDALRALGRNGWEVVSVDRRRPEDTWIRGGNGFAKAPSTSTVRYTLKRRCRRPS